MRRLPLLFLALLACACAFPAGAQATEPLRVEDLQVEGGEESWHASNAFRLSWTQVPGPPLEPRAVLYRLSDSAGHLVAGTVRDTVNPLSIDPLEVPPVPGVYTAEVWLENDAGQLGPAARAKLRFDDTAPPAPAPHQPAGWLAGPEVAVLKIDHPTGALPPSGIRGYAISLDAGGGSSPCLHVDWCSVAETDLPQGIGDDTIALGTLPEGEASVRVVAVSGSGVASPVRGVVFRSDATLPRLSLQGVAGGWSGGPVRLTVLAADELSGMTAAGPTGPFAAVAVDGAPPARAEGDSISTWVAGSGIHRVSYFAKDAAGNVADGATGSPPPTTSIRIDEEPPRVLFAPAQDPSEPERIEATVADSLSGPSADRGSIRLRRTGTPGRFEELPTRVVGDRLVARWDSDSYPTGKYEFLATGYDLAGNAATGGNRARGGRMVLVNPLKTMARLEAGFGARRTRRISFSHAMPFGGRLRNISGAPLAGQEVAVTETFAPGSRPPQRTTRIRTRSDGTFSLRLAPGPSREVSAAFAGTKTLTRASAESVRLYVPAAVHLRASAARAKVGGRPIVFSGRVALTGVAPAAEGLPVELQFRYPGAGWSAFRTVQTDARGRFRYAYRFSDDDSRGVRFQFRAHVKGREGWPYEPAYSRPVAVTGR